MIVLSIGSDKKLFEAGSPVRKRMIEYSSLFDELHIVVFAHKKLKLKAEQISSSVWIYPTNSSSKIGLVRDAIAIGKRIARERKCTSHNAVVSCQDPFEAGIVGWFLKRSCALPLHIQIHIDFFSPYFKKESWRQWIQVLIGPIIIRRADAIRAVSQKIRDYVVNVLGIDSRTVMVLPILTPIDTIRNQPIVTDVHNKYPQFETILLVAARLVKQKNITLAIQALAQIAEKYPGAGLLIVGSGSEAGTLQILVKRLRLEQRVVFESWSNDLSSYYKTSDIFLMPSLYEGWGLTVIEACACGLPVIMTDVGCAQEFIRNNENGFIVPVNDLNSFVYSLQILLDDPEHRERIAQSAYESVARLMTKETYMKMYKESLKQALDMASHSR